MAAPPRRCTPYDITFHTEVVLVITRLRPETVHLHDDTLLRSFALACAAHGHGHAYCALPHGDAEQRRPRPQRALQYSHPSPVAPAPCKLHTVPCCVAGSKRFASACVLLTTGTAAQQHDMRVALTRPPLPRPRRLSGVCTGVWRHLRRDTRRREHWGLVRTLSAP